MSVLTLIHIINTAGDSFRIRNLGYTGSVTVDWGDGTTTTETSNDFNHSYSETGTYTVEVTGSITSLGDACFYQRSGLISITIPNTVTSLGEYCFESTGLTSIVIPYSITSLPLECFLLSTIQSIVLPSSLTSIGDKCFEDCYSLGAVYFNSEVPPSCGTQAWRHLPHTCKLYVPDRLSAYTSASGYPDPNTYTYLEYNGSYSISFDDTEYYVCNGSATVKVTLLGNSVPISGATVSLTGTGSSLTATTDSDGIATFNLTNISESAVLTAAYDTVFDTAVLFFLNKNTLFGSLYCLGRRLVHHLEAKGITGIDFTDGLTSLVDEIINIEPSIGGIVLDTALSCTASNNNVDLGDTVTFTGKLSCSFDDETQSDDDMEGYIKTALIEFYNGNTLLGSTSTDSNGEYSFAYVTTTAGTMSVIASYDGTDYYEDCVSSAVSVVVNDVTPVPDSISLTADKSILSYADSESATLSATVLDQFDNPMENETVEFFNGSTSMGTATTNSSGVATKTYSSSGVGDVSFTAAVRSLVSESFELEDCLKTFMNTYSSQVTLNYSLPTNYKIQFILNSNNRGDPNYCYIRFDSSSGVYVGKGSSSNRNIIINNPYGALPTGLPVSTDTEYTFIKNNGTVSLSDGTDTISGSSSAFTKLDHVKGSSNGVVKNIKVKPL